VLSLRATWFVLAMVLCLIALHLSAVPS